MNCQTAPVIAPAFGEAWRVNKGRTEAPAPELALSSESFALASQIIAAPPAKRAEKPQDTTPDLFTL